MSSLVKLLSVIRYLLSAIRYRLSAIHYLLSAICYLLSAIYIYYLLSTIYYLEEWGDGHTYIITIFDIYMEENKLFGESLSVSLSISPMRVLEGPSPLKT